MNDVDSLVEECTGMLLEIQSLSEVIPQMKQFIGDIETASEEISKKTDNARSDLNALISEGKKIIQDGINKINELDEKAKTVADSLDKIEDLKKELVKLAAENKSMQRQIIEGQNSYAERISKLERQIQLISSQHDIAANTGQIGAPSGINKREMPADIKGSIKELIEASNNTFPIDVHRINSNWPSEMHFVIDHIDGEFAHGIEYMGEQKRRENVNPLDRAGFEFEFYKNNV